MKRTGQSKIAVVGWGRGMGHKGHMYLADAVIEQAKAMNADPYFFVSKTVGKDDPIFPEEKVKIYQKVFPQQATIFAAEGNLNQALTELAQQGYQGVVVVVGADQKQAFQYLEKPNKEGVPVYQTMGLKKLRVISRQETPSQYAQEEGPRATPMREILLSPDASEQDKFKVWRRDMPEQLGDDMVLDLMHKAESRMLGAKPAAKTPKVNAMKKVTNKPLAEGVQCNPNEVAELLYNAKPEIFSRFGDDFVMDAITQACEQYTGSAQKVAVKVVDILKQGIQESEQRRTMGLDASLDQHFNDKKHLLNPGVAHRGQLVTIIKAPRMLDLLPGETFEVRTSDADGVTLKHGMGTKFDNVKFPHGTYKIAKAQGLKEGVVYNTLNIDNQNLIDQKAKSKPDGLYTFRGIMFRVRNGRVTHYAAEGTILVSYGNFNSAVGSYSTRDEAKAKLKSIKEGVDEAYDHSAPFNAADFNRHMAQLRAREELRKTDPMKALVGDMIDKDNAARAVKKKPEDDSIGINDPRHPGYAYSQAGQHTVDEGLMWDDTDSRMSIDDRLSVIESYYASKSETLAEANDQGMTEYFLNLTSMSDKPTKNSESLMLFLALMNNKVVQLAYPEQVTVLAKQGNEYTVKMKNGTTKQFPSKSVRDKLVAATFFFNNSESFDKFRNIMSLKFDMNFSEYSEYAGPDINEGEEDALAYATKAHAGQTRSGGDPYITHPMRVADHIRKYKQSHNLDALISAAYLHDTIEDTSTTQEALHDLFGGLVASLVQELTSDPEQIKKMGKKHYLAHKMAAMSSYGLVIKLADRLDNVKDITTAKTPEWRHKYAAETNHILDYIEKTRALSGTHRKLISLIRAKLAEIDNPVQPEAQLKEFAPGNGDDGIPHAEYQVYQCNPKDQFEWIGGPLYQTDSMGMAHKYAYEMYLKHRPKAFMVWQAHTQGSRGNYGVKGESDHDESELKEDSQLERKITRVQSMIQDFHNRAKATKNDIKKNHYLQMADQLQTELDRLINDANEQERDGNMVAQHDSESSDTWNRGGLAEDYIDEK